MGRMQRNKGAAFERLCAQDFRDLGFEKARRHLEYNAEDAEDGCDLQGTGKVRVQCKCKKSYASVNTIDEIKKPGIKLLLTKADRKPVMAVMEWSQLKAILNDVGLFYCQEDCLSCDIQHCKLRDLRNRENRDA